MEEQRRKFTLMLSEIVRVLDQPPPSARSPTRAIATQIWSAGPITGSARVDVALTRSGTSLQRNAGPPGAEGATVGAVA
jgi:hypothetical protein